MGIQHFAASWSQRVRIVTGLVVALVVGLSLYSTLTPDASPWPATVVIGLVVALLLVSVRGYSVTQDSIKIHRLGWSSTLPLSSIEDIQMSPGATLGSARIFGVGGLLGYYGWFRNDTLGTYRVYGTNESNTVVVHLDEQTIVITPDDPGTFIDAVQSRQSVA